MTSDDLDTRVGILESKVDNVCRFIGGVFSISYIEEVKSLQHNIEQLRTSFEQSINETRKEITDLDLSFKQNIKEIGRKFQEEIRRSVVRLETKFAEIEGMTKEKKERNKNLALELFIVDTKENVTNFKIKDKSIGQVGVDNLSGLSLIMGQYEKVSLEQCFSSCSNLTTIEFPPNFNTSNVTNMYRMFWGCDNLALLDLSMFNTSNVTDIKSMFSGCNGLTSLDLSLFSTGSVTNMSYMFNGCSSLASLDLSSFNTSKVTDMSYMFYGCNSLGPLDLSMFITSSATNMRGMFYG